MIALLDYGSGNLRSVHKSLLKVGANVRLVQRPDEIGDARGLVLPGVGAFDDCINALRKQGLLEAASRFWASAWGIRPCLKRARNSIPVPPGWGCFRAASSALRTNTG